MKNKIPNIVKDIYSFNNFVNGMEISYGHLESWLNLEILNALALDEWEMSGKPLLWENWECKYKDKARDLLLIFLKEHTEINRDSVPSYNRATRFR